MRSETLIWLLPLLLAFGGWMAVRLWYGRGESTGGPAGFPFFASIRILLLLLVCVVLFSGAASIFGVIIALLAAVTLVEAVIERRAARRRTMATLLALTVERGQQLDAVALLAGLPENDTVGRASAKLFRLLGDGVPLAEAIQKCPKALPREAVAYVAAGQTIEAEAAALKELSHGDRTNLTAVWRSYLDRTLLPCGRARHIVGGHDVCDDQNHSRV